MRATCKAMIKLGYTSKTFLLAILLLLGTLKVIGADRYSVATGNWSSTSTWAATSGGTSGVSVPVAGDNVFIEGGRTVTVTVAAACTNVSVASGSSLTIGGFNFIVSGTTTIIGTVTHTSTTGTKTMGNVVMSGGTWTSSAAETYGITEMTLSGSTIGGASLGIFNIGASGLNVTSSTSNTINSATFNVTGPTLVDGTLIFGNATGIKTFIGQVTVNDTWNNSANEGITFRGGIINNGTFISGTGTYTFNTSNQSIGGTSPIVFDGIVAITGAISISNSGNVTVTGNLTGSVAGSTWINAVNSTLSAGNAILATGTLNASASGNTVNYSGAAQAVKATTYTNLAFSGSGAKSVASGTSVSGNLSITGTTASIVADQNISVGSLTLDGEDTPSGSWGSTSSTATYTNNTYFASTTGKLIVTNSSCAVTAPSASDATICIGQTTELTASGASPTAKYKWYDAATGGILLKTSTNNSDNTYTTPVLSATTNYWVSIITQFGCESARTMATATFPSISADDQNAAGTNSWIGHVYDGTNFNTYYGSYTETETFNELFGGNTNCFAIASNSTIRSIYTETFSVRYRMNSTKKGLYVVDLGSDDGGQLTVDGNLLYNNWSDQGYSTRAGVLMSLNGGSSLVYDFYENAGGNQVVFQNLSLVLSNSLSTNLSQSICPGTSGVAISGDVYGALPSGISLSGTGYQWSYSTTPGGIRTDISGATSATYIPDATVAPFNISGTYYIYRNAVLSSANNVSPIPYVASNESNAATLTVITGSIGGTISGGNSPICLGAASGTLTLSGHTGTIVRWERQINSGGWTNINNSGSTTFAETPWSAGTWEYRAVIQNGACPPTYSAVRSISIDAITVAGWISGSSAPLCEGASTGTITLNGSTGSVVRWEKRLNSGSWVNIANTATTYSEIPTSSGTWEYRALVQSGNCTALYPSSFSMTVIPTLTITLGSNPSICSGVTNASLAYSATTGNPSAYSIDFDATANAAGLGDVSGWGLPANTITINVPWNITPGTYNGILSVATTYPVCTSIGYSFTVTINPAPVATFSYTGTPYCQGAANPLPTFSGGGIAGNFTSTAGLVFANSSTGQINLAASTSGGYVVTNTIPAAGGCSLASATSNITISPSVAVPVFALGPSSSRSQGAGTLPYSATAANNTGITYSLDAASLAGGNTISAATGSVTFAAGWIGSSVITATATGCDGPTSSTHTVTTSMTAVYYSYQSGNWNNPNTWTYDPGGSTGPITTFPANSDKVVILTGRTVTLTADVTTTNHDITIQTGGFLDQSTFRFTTTLTALRGDGTLQLASANFPTVTNNTFVTTDGGNTEYRTVGAFDLPAAQTIYYHLTINNTGETARQINNLVINGNLNVEKGTYQINNGTANRRQLTIKGNVAVDAGASITVGNGNTLTGADAPLTVSNGGTAPFLNYYNNETHRVIIQGDFINNGTVRFTNQTVPKYDAFTTTGAATVYFQGSSNNVLTCNGTTDFYNLIIDKGTDQTFKLTVYSNAYPNFRLFGANNAPSANSTVANPDLKKALWVRNGTLVLQGLTVIPSLSEGTTAGPPASHYYIPANGAMVLDGTEVIVLSTADDYTEVKVAYNLGTGSSNSDYGIDNGTASVSGLSVLGKLQINNGYLSTRESAGILYWSYSSGQLIVNGGILDTKQIDDGSGGNAGLITYRQSGGSAILRGRFKNNLSYTIPEDLANPVINTTRAANGTDGAAGTGTFHLNTNTANGFIMSGGNISIYDVTGTTATSYAAFIGCPASNINVSGGTVKIIPTTGTGTDMDYLINTKSPFANLVVNRVSGAAKVSLNSNPLVILQNLDLQSGILDANLQDITVGGNFSIAAGTTYTCTGTSANRTIFNGSAAQNFAINTGSALNINKLKINKPAGIQLTLTGTQTSLNIADSLIIIEGGLNDNGKTVNASGNIYNSGIHSGTGKIILLSDANQTVDGDGTGEFTNLELNKPTNGSASVMLNSNTIINGTLTFSGSATGYKVFNIQSNNLKLTTLAAISGANANRYIQTSGALGDGGLSKVYNSGSSFTFPIGSPSTSHASANYSPAIITINGTPTVPGTITINPVGYEHPATKFKGRSLTYYWHVKSADFTLGSATVTQGFTYSQNDVPAPSGDADESGYVAARFNNTTFAWSKGTANDVDIVNNFIGEPGTGNFLENVATIDGDYTAGDDVATDPFGVPTVFYSRANARWNLNTTWSTDPVLKHTGAAAASFPGATDIVVIGNNNTINLTAVANCASLQIQAGSVLDIYTWTTSKFSIVLNHPLGNGLFRLTTTVTGSNVPKQFSFPTNSDFSDFNNNQGTTEFYDIDGSTGALYILPSSVTTYGNLMVTAKGGDNLVLPNNVLTTIKGDLTCGGDNANAWIAVSWNTNIAPYNSGIYNPTVEKTIHVTGDLNINTGTFIFMPEVVPQHLIIDGNVTVGTNGYIDVQPAVYGVPAGTPQPNTIAIGGNFVNNSSGAPYVRLLNSGYYCDLTFQGSNNATISGTSPTTILNKVVVNKGNSQGTTLTLTIGGALTTLTDNWLTLQNGTFRYMRTNPGTDFTISAASAFTIPATAGLYVDYSNTGNKNILIANSNSNTNDLYLFGKLTLLRGNIYVGPTNGTTVNNNDIEYSSGGASTIDVRGGNLTVNGQIRRNPSNAGGILNYSQSGGTVTINGQAALAANAKLEVLNNGSSFTMSNGTINFIKGGGTTFGDLYLRPQTGNVTGGSIVFTPGTNGAQTYQVDANTALNHFTVSSTAGNVGTLKLMVSPLTLNGDLTISTNSIFNTNSINTTFNGNFINNVGTAGYIAGTNLTTFSASNSTVYLGAQSLTGSTNFYNLQADPDASVTVNSACNVLNNMVLGSGNLILGSNLMQVSGNFTNNGRFTDSNLANTGIKLVGSAKQFLSGNGSFGRLEINNGFGVQTLNDITMEENLVLTLGVLDINQNLLSLGLQSNIQGAPFSWTKMIKTDGVFSDEGIRKLFPAGPSSAFVYPIGCLDKYTPATLTINASSTVGYVQISNINQRHPVVIDPANALDYYWTVTSSGITGFTGTLLFNYLQSDVRGVQENSYLSARLIVPGTSWSMTNTIDATNNILTFNHTGSNNLGGEYTAGISSAFPPDIPVYTSNTNGNWTDKTIWTQTGGTTYPCPDGGPNGFIVIVNHEVTANNNHCIAYRTTINNKLKIVSPYFGHNLGTVDGNGILYVESGSFPAGTYTTFLDCANNGTVEYSGTGSYTIVADLYTNIPNMLVSGTGTRILPAKNLTICNSLKINGPTLDNSINNQKLTILGTMELISGAFKSGSGSNATVSFGGNSAQTIGGSLDNFTGSNAFNNFEINNISGLSVNTGGAIEVNGELRLTSGLINTNPAAPWNCGTLTITNTATTCVVPSGGSSSSFINGPLTKSINQGDDFLFPVGTYIAGVGNIAGNKLRLSSSKSGTILWTAEYKNPNPTFVSFSAPLQGVSSKEYWRVQAVAGSKSIINITWDPQSDITPLVTINGLADMSIASYSAGTWNPIASSATGNDYDGTASSSSFATSAGTNDYTLASLSIVRPKAKLDPLGPVCGNSGIPVSFISLVPTPLNYTLSYTVNGTAQTPVTISSLPYILPTPTSGIYALTGFTYNNGAGTGVVDASTVTVNAIPTTADAGPDQSLCGITSANLNANPLGISVGTGVWKIISGSGGTLITPTSRTSQFIGLNGASYRLRWTISNGTCTSSDDVIINFTLLPLAPSAAASQTLCAGSIVNSIQVTPPSGSTVSWFTIPTGGTALAGTLALVSGDYYAESNGGTGCLSLTRTKVTVTVIEEVWTGSVSTDWNVATNWSCGIVPNLTLNIQIPNVPNKPILSSGAVGACKNILIAAGSSVTVTGNTLQIAGTITNNGTFTSTAGTIEMRGAVAQTIASGVFAGNTIKGLTINNSTGVTLTGPLNVTAVVNALSGNLFSGGNLTLISTVTQTALIDGTGTGTITGNVTMQRYLPSGYGYKYLSSPFQAATVNELADDVDLLASFPNLYAYDEDNHRDSSGVSIYTTGWSKYVTTSNLLLPMKGYAANLGSSAAAKTVTITGVVNNNIATSQTLYNHNRPFTQGFNLAGNPYPSPIDWNAATGWTKTNIDNAIYFFDNGTTNQYTGSYSSYVNGVSSNGFAGSIVSSMQGFFIHVTNGSYPVTATLGMDNRVRVNNLAPAFHKSTYESLLPLVRINAAFENANLSDPAVLYFDNLALNTFDQQLDALKLFNTDESIPNLYAVTPGSDRLSISAIPYPVDSISKYPLGIKTAKTDWVLMSASQIENLPSGLRVYLSDAATGLVQDLQINPKYRVHLSSGTVENRFVLLFSEKNLVNSLLDEDTFYANIVNGKLVVFVKLATGDKARLVISNMLGQVMLRDDNFNDGSHEINQSLPSGMYVITLYSQKGMISKKIYIPK